MNYMDVMDERYSCRNFDPKKDISDINLKEILEAGRKSPSSIGIEPWMFYVIESKSLKHDIRLACNNQPQVEECAKLVVVLAKIDDLRPNRPHADMMVTRRHDKSDAQKEEYKKWYKARFEGLSDEALYHYSSLQCYIASTNMVNMAASLGIQSCIVAGFDKKTLESTLNLDPLKLQVSLVLCFGYAASPRKQAQLRRSFDSVVKFIY
ncbi:NAD(P)H-dependent oxidoreductase [Helicobacter sp. 11S02629-2]|uniref:NAD(P)H-dependent oxidoreductase n=1 Tax=Helicobacter sp. 11S02629-2 TaxID=1476195 RepID=UPI0015DB40B8|nr:NAD(P)H-dependent oxidoreductase [Helicobacter sp. 11S02629-2]